MWGDGKWGNFQAFSIISRFRIPLFLVYCRVTWFWVHFIERTNFECIHFQCTNLACALILYALILYGLILYGLILYGLILFALIMCSLIVYLLTLYALFFYALILYALYALISHALIWSELSYTSLHRMTSKIQVTLHFRTTPPTIVLKWKMSQPLLWDHHPVPILSTLLLPITLVASMGLNVMSLWSKKESKLFIKMED